MLHPITEQEFNELAKQGYNRIPLVAETFADLDTPLSLYLKLANKPYSYLLESVQGGERFGRYSFIGLPADTRITVHGKTVTLTKPSGDTTHNVDNPLDYIQHYQSQFKVAPLSGLPRFTGGLAGSGPTVIPRWSAAGEAVVAAAIRIAAPSARNMGCVSR